MSLPDDILEKYQRAGKIAGEVRTEMRDFVREGMPVIEICEHAEKLVVEKGGKPAFPCNVSVNHVAAHYTSPPGDRSVIPSKALVKVDIGAQIDGYIADTAVTVCFNPEYQNLVLAAEEALKTATQTIQAGMSTSRLGSAIQKTIKAFGCKAVSNLTGHQIGRYLIHTGKSLPNISHFIGSKIMEGEVVAIEPFVTVQSAAGRVEDSPEKTIFRFAKRKTIQNRHTRHLLDYIERTFRTLPFAERWLKGVLPVDQHSLAFRELVRMKCLSSYNVFIESSGKPVAQAEHTVIVVKNGCQILT
jgi:methionyl aminopeptidase